MPHDAPPPPTPLPALPPAPSPTHAPAYTPTGVTPPLPGLPPLPDAPSPPAAMRPRPTPGITPPPTPPPPTFRVLAPQPALRAVWAADPVDLSTVQLDPMVIAAVHVDEAQLSREFAELPSHTARASEVYARLKERSLKADLHVKRTRAAQAGAIRTHLGMKSADNPGGRVTEAMVAEMLTLDPAVIEAEDVAVYAELLVNEARGVLTALSRKAEALVTIGANLRQERAFGGVMYDQPRTGTPAPPGLVPHYPHHAADGFGRDDGSVDSDGQDPALDGFTATMDGPSDGYRGGRSYKR